MVGAETEPLDVPRTAEEELVKSHAGSLEARTSSLLAHSKCSAMSISAVALSIISSERLIHLSDAVRCSSWPHRDGLEDPRHRDHRVRLRRERLDLAKCGVDLLAGGNAVGDNTVRDRPERQAHSLLGASGAPEGLGEARLDAYEAGALNETMQPSSDEGVAAVPTRGVDVEIVGRVIAAHSGSVNRPP
jgi:hypothetical protein